MTIAVITGAGSGMGRACVERLRGLADEMQRLLSTARGRNLDALDLLRLGESAGRPEWTAAARFFDDYTAVAVVQSDDTARHFLEFAAPGAELADKVAMKKLTENYELGEQPEDEAPFEKPTLILTGRQDHLVGFGDALRHLEHYPRATFATLDGAGHNVHFERPDLVSALVADWLTRMRDLPA